MGLWAKSVVIFNSIHEHGKQGFRHYWLHAVCRMTAITAGIPTHPEPLATGECRRDTASRGRRGAVEGQASVVGSPDAQGPIADDMSGPPWPR
jgi:hypothetical protein